MTVDGKITVLKSHCKRGHKYTAKNTGYCTIKSKRTKTFGKVYKYQRCLTCISDRYRLRYRNDEEFRRKRLAVAQSWHSRNRPPKDSHQITCTEAQTNAV